MTLLLTSTAHAVVPRRRSTASTPSFSSIQWIISRSSLSLICNARISEVVAMSTWNDSCLVHTAASISWGLVSPLVSLGLIIFTAEPFFLTSNSSPVAVLQRIGYLDTDSGILISVSSLRPSSVFHFIVARKYYSPSLLLSLIALIKLA